MSIVKKDTEACRTTTRRTVRISRDANVQMVRVAKKHFGGNVSKMLERFFNGSVDYSFDGIEYYRIKDRRDGRE